VFPIDSRSKLFQGSDSNIQENFIKCLGEITQVTGNETLSGFPWVEWLMCEDPWELPAGRPDVIDDIAFCGFLLSCAGDQGTGLMVLGPTDEDRKKYSECCRWLNEKRAMDVVCGIQNNA